MIREVAKSGDIIFLGKQLLFCFQAQCKMSLHLKLLYTIVPFSLSLFRDRIIPISVTNKILRCDNKEIDFMHV